jgi:hypothetical protein
MDTEQVIKKEGSLTYKKGFLRDQPGDLVLTATELFFVSADKKQFSIPLKDILNSRAEKGLGNGIDYLIITYKEGDVDKLAKIEHFSFWKGMAIGNLSQLKEPYFKSWETLIEETRLGKNAKNGFDEIERLGDLKAKGYISEEEFTLKKKQILGI